MKRIAILGSTGSVGTSTLDVARNLRDECRVTGLAARSSWEILRDQIREFRPTRAAMLDPQALASLRAAVNGDTKISSSAVEIATAPDVDVVLSAITGAAGLEPGLAALAGGKTLALANKESLVVAGPLMLEAAKKAGVEIVPVDSEHSAIFQAMRAGATEEVRRIILTASGGPFRGKSRAEIAAATPEQALKHPTWNMGNKITIDSATMFNKALEIIEARWLFGLRPDQIEVVIHPQSIVHSMVELTDGSIIAQLGVTDMRLPIQYACSYPDRWEAPLPSLDLTRVGRLDFHAPACDRFPCLELAYRALRAGETVPVVLNAANEVAVEAFLDGKLGFTSIPRVIERVMSAHTVEKMSSLQVVRRVDNWSREYAREMARELELTA